MIPNYAPGAGMSGVVGGRSVVTLNNKFLINK